MRMEHQQLMENSHISNDETDNSLSNSNQDGIREDRLSRRRERDRLRRQRETSQERHARLKLSVPLHVSELWFNALFRLARHRDYDRRRRAAMRAERHQQLRESSHVSNEETNNSHSNEDRIREDGLSRRRERDRSRMQRETSRERDARLKLSMLLHVSELNFVT